MRLTQDAIQRAARTGALPHEILLDMARGMPQRMLKYKGLNEHGELIVEEEWVELTIEDRKEAAKAAAPYYAPKLSSVETVQGISDNDLDSLIKQLAAEAGVGTGTGGEGTPPQGDNVTGGDAPSGEGGSRPRRRIQP
jgi:hypothetical protein